MKKKRLVDVFPDWYSGLIFDGLARIQTDPLLPMFSSINDIEYFGNHSGGKLISPLIERLLKVRDLDEADAFIINDVINVIYNRYAVKWLDIWNALQIEYDPLYNYNMTETRTPDLTDVETPDITRESTASEATNVTTTTSGDATADAYAFNSTSPVGISETNAGQTQTVEGDADDNTRTVEETETGTRTMRHTGTETLTRSGNIGVTTSQQMLQSEIDIRQFDFYEMVYKDVDNVLTINMY